MLHFYSGVSTMYSIVTVTAHTFARYNVLKVRNNHTTGITEN